MKRFVKLVTLALALMILPMAALAEDATGSAAVTEDATYTVEQMLTYAMQDEYMAQAEYAAIQEAFGISNPYTNIEQAEVRHEQLLLPLFEAYGIPVPENTAASSVVIPATLAETYAIGVQAEINNIAMYQAFLDQGDVSADVAAVFLALIRASESHLNAFSRGASRFGVDGVQVQAYGRGGRQAMTQTAVYGRGNRQAAATQTYGRNQRNATGTRLMDPANCPFLSDDAAVQQP